MKIIFSLLLPVLLQAQNDSIINYTDVVRVDSVKREELFIRARQWYNETFKSAKDVLQINDKETGELSGKGNLLISVTIKMMGERSYPSTCAASISIFVKDGKYRYSFTNLQVAIGAMDNRYNSTDIGILTSSTACPFKWSMYSQKKMNEMWESAKSSTEKEIMRLIKSLNDRMQKKSDADF